MAYTPINWQTGDTITAEKLNKMDNGWGVESTQLFSETVSTVVKEWGTVGQLTYNSVINAPTIIVTFDGTDYECSRTDAFDSFFYGGFGESGPDFTDYPFLLNSAPDGTNMLYTAAVGTYTVAAIAQGIETSTRFDAAVNKAVVFKDSAFEVISGTTTWQEVHDALIAGKYVYAVEEYMRGNDNITSVGQALRTDTQRTSTQGYEVILAAIIGDTTPSLSIYSLTASSADGVLS